MKRIISLSVFIALFFSSQARYFKSNGTGGGKLDLGTTWQNGGSIPTSDGDTVEILSGDNVTFTTTEWPDLGGCKVDIGGTFQISNHTNIFNYIINNGAITGSGGLLYILNGVSKHGNIAISGTGTWSSYTGTIYFASNNITIASGCTVNLPTGAIVAFDPNDNANSAITIDNQGNFTANAITNKNTGAVCTWINDVNSSLTLSAASFPGTDVLTTSASGNTVFYEGTASYNINLPTGSTFYNLEIANAGIKTLNFNPILLGSLTILSDGKLNANAHNITLAGNWVNNITTGAITNLTGTVTFNGTAAQTIGGSAITTFNNLIINNAGNTVTLGNSMQVNSALTITTGTLDVSGSNYSIGVADNFINNATFNARAGTVIFNGNLAGTIGGTTSTTFYNLTIAATGGHITSLGNNETVSNTLLISSPLDVSTSNYNLTIGQNFTNNSTFTPRSGTVTFTGNTASPLNINGTTATPFYNLTTNPTNVGDIVMLGNAIAISNNFTISKGVFSTQIYQITGGPAGHMSMAANTSLLLGLTTAANNIVFPLNYVTANIALNTTSTVAYQSNVAQTISTTPNYGNLIVTNGATAVVKTPSGTPLNINGNLTITQGAGALTLSQTTSTINLTGNYTSSGTLSFSTGAFNIGGNYANNGTFTAGTSTTTFDGSTAQALGGTSATTFNQLIINNSGASTITLGDNTITNSNLTITAGTLDVSASNYSLTVGGNFTNNATFNARAGTVTMNGAAAQTLGGTTSTTFYNLTSNGTTVSLGNNETVSNTLLIGAGTLDASTSNYNLTIGQNFTNNSIFTPRNGTVTLTGNTTTPLNINGSAASTSFYNLTVNPTNITDIVLLGVASTIGNNFTISKGTFNSQNFQVTGNATGTMSMAANTSLLLGLTTNATNILFPTNYTAITLTAPSLVTYQANGAQTISTAPTYSNLIVTNGASAAVKTPSGTPLNIGGNLTITQGAGALTLSQTTNTINLTGNYTSSGTLSFSTGAFNIGGNYANNGTFTAGTGTTTFDGSTAQALGGTSATTFNQLTINNSGASTVTLGDNTTVNSALTLTTGTLDVSASNYSLTVGGNFTNNASFNAETGTVAFNGSALQTLGGANNTRFSNMTLSGTGGVNLATNTGFTGALTISNSGSLSSSASIYDTIISNSSATAYIAQVTGTGTITANFVAQRYESARGTVGQYAGLSTPMNSSENLADWKNSNTTPPNTLFMSIDGSVSDGVYSVYNYVETKPNATCYVAIKNSSTTIPEGEGIFMFLANDKTGVSTYTMIDPFTYIQHGVPNVGTVSIGVTKTASPGGQGGYNLVGNPYASPISWAQFQADNIGLALQSNYYIMETSGSWTATAANSIPMCQGFLIAVSSAGTASFKEDQKIVANPSLLREASISENNSVSFVLSNDANSLSCPTTIAFNPNYTKDYSPNEDAYFIPSPTEGVPMLYTSTWNNENLQINSLPNADKEVDVPLVTIGQVEAMHTLTIQNLNNFSSYKSVTLIDKASGQTLANFNQNPNYNFNISQLGEEKDFIVRFSNTPANTTNTAIANNIVIRPSVAGAVINFALTQPENTEISVYNILGEKTQSIETSAYNNALQVNLSSGGIYIVRVITPDGVTTEKIYH